jgi:hypothetical protein
LPLPGGESFAVIRQDPPLPHAEIRARLGIPVGRVGSSRDAAWTS